MLKYLHRLLLVILLAATTNIGYAAFPVTARQPITSSSTPAYHAKKAFSERRIPQLLHRAEEKLFRTAKPEKHKTSWPGIVSLASAVMFIAAVSVLPVLCLPFSVAAIVFGILGLNKKRYKLRGLALAGLTLGGIELMIVLTVLAILSIVKSITINVM